MQPMRRSHINRAPTAVVGEFSAFGMPSEESIRQGNKQPLRDVSIAARCILQSFLTIHEGVTIEEDVVIEDYCRIGANTQIGARTRIIYGAYLCDDVVIGQDCRIAGFLCDDIKVGDRCTVMGTLVHDYNQPHRGWWDVTEPAPSIQHDTIVGISSTVVGDVTIGPYSYVAAGALVTRSVPSWHIAIERNNFIHWKQWSGAPLKELFSHWESTSGEGSQ